MRALGKIAATLGVIGTIAVGSVVPAAAWYGYGYGYYHPHYNGYYGGGYPTWNGCPPRWTVQGGLCKPYHYGPWDWHGPRYGYWR